MVRADEVRGQRLATLPEPGARRHWERRVRLASPVQPVPPRQLLALGRQLESGSLLEQRPPEQREQLQEQPGQVLAEQPARPSPAAVPRLQEPSAQPGQGPQPRLRGQPVARQPRLERRPLARQVQLRPFSCP
jgi:hypothetical protein